MNSIPFTETAWINGNQFYLPDQIKNLFSTTDFATMDYYDLSLLGKSIFDKYDYFSFRERSYYDEKISKIHKQEQADTNQVLKNMEENIVNISMDDNGLITIPPLFMNKLKECGKVFCDTLLVSYSSGFVELVHPSYFASDSDKNTSIEDLVNEICQYPH